MKNIAIFQSDLGVGGIQKSLINLLNNMDLQKYHVDLYLIDDKSFYSASIPKAVQIKQLKKYPFLFKFIYFDLLRIFAARPAKTMKYDVAIDFNSYQNECALGALSVNAEKRVQWIHNDVEKKLEEDRKYRFLWHFFKGKLKYFDEFAAVSHGITEPFRRVSGISDCPIHVIPNFIDTTEILNKRTEPVDFTVDRSKFNLATMGRLCHQKGFDLLIGHLKEVAAQRKDVKLYIIGDGPERESLEKLTKQNHLSEYVEFLGNQPNPFPYLDQMDGFALTSRYEGQGMVIWEAMALGLQLFVSKNLELYNEGIKGCDDFEAALISAQKQEKKVDHLNDYNNSVILKFENMLNTEIKKI